MSTSGKDFLWQLHSAMLAEQRRSAREAVVGRITEGGEATNGHCFNIRAMLQQHRHRVIVPSTGRPMDCAPAKPVLALSCVFVRCCCCCFVRAQGLYSQLRPCAHLVAFPCIFWSGARCAWPLRSGSGGAWGRAAPAPWRRGSPPRGARPQCPPRSLVWTFHTAN